MRRPSTDAPFVHVGRAGDPDLRWLVDAPLPPESCAYLFDDEPTLYAPQAASTDLGAVAGRVVETADDPTLALVDALPDGAVCAPRHVPHDAALRVERAGHDLRSTTAVAEARAQKDERERAALSRAARAARAGVERAREVLSAGADGELAVTGDEREDESAVERLRRQVASGVAAAGATPAVGVDGPFRAGAPVVVDASARVDGRWARLARTLVVGGDGGAVRRTQVAAESALRVAAGEATPGTEVDWLAAEVRAELGSFGVEPVGQRVVAGTGLARREAPLVGTDAALETGHALVVAPAGRVPETDAAVRLANTLVVGEDRARVLGG
ncbi:MAG: M24 family metallopeptidase [Haloferacaceae archaeon]